MRSYLLVGEQRVGLQRAQVTVDESRGSVVFAEQAAVDVVEPISGNQSVPAGGARETLWCWSAAAEGRSQIEQVRKKERERETHEKSARQKRMPMGGRKLSEQHVWGFIGLKIQGRRVSI